MPVLHKRVERPWFAVFQILVESCDHDVKSQDPPSVFVAYSEERFQFDRVAKWF